MLEKPLQIPIFSFPNHEYRSIIMKNPDYSSYNGALNDIKREFILYLKHTFGELVKYLGITTDLSTSLSRIRDIDLLVVFTKLNESQIIYIWRIINKLHSKYNIFLDARIYSEDQLSDIPILNKFLLKEFLNDEIGINPFIDFTVDQDQLIEQCLIRIKDQENKIISIMPRIAGDPNHIRSVAQSVYDAIRAFLVIMGHPIASKEKSCNYFIDKYPNFKEAKAIYDGYLDPNSIVDVASFILDSLAIVKHLYYAAEKKVLSNDLLLINTPSSKLAHPRDDYLSYDHNMPLGLVCLASFIEAKGYSVSIIDAYAENLGVLSTIDRIFTKESIPKLIGLNSASPNIHIVHRIAHCIKRIRNDVTIVCGGPHATLAKEHTLSTKDIDYIIEGEGEIPLLNLFHAILNNKTGVISKMPGVFFLRDGEVIGNQANETLDLAEIPLPKFEFLPIQRYFDVRRRIYLHTSRGCAFNCIYCSVPKCWGKRVREIPMDLLISQISSILDKNKPEEIQIVDDNFSHKKGTLIKAFCKGVLDNGLKFKWKCQVRSDQLDNETVRLMADAGCFEVDMGIESGNEAIQKYIRKNINLSKTINVVSSIKAAGIFTKSFFMLGFPNETPNQIADTINYAIKLKNHGLDDIAIFPVMPFPGTEISEITKQIVYQGAIIDDVDLYERSFAAHRLRKYSAKPEISLNDYFNPEQLRLLVKFAYQRFQLGAKVQDLEEEFDSFALLEESNSYGI